ncbi:maker182 [Drosophila busckii]|uniref:Maker182 n=1 Tax=Drosophila busckii TaxID=30019 RepID=A0A0M4ET96_DROBS|nr:maker182 [Drosophila busckii]
MFKKANGFKPWLFNTTIDACRFLKKPYDPFIIIVYKIVRNYISFKHPCPYVGHVSVDGLPLTYESLQLPFPDGEFLFSKTYYFHKRKAIFAKTYFSIKEDL